MTGVFSSEGIDVILIGLRLVLKFFMVGIWRSEDNL